MDVAELLKSAKSFDEITDTIIRLADDDSPQAFESLTQFLRVKDPHTYGKHSTPAIACRALLGLGAKEVEAMYSALLNSDGVILPTIILDHLWHASHGEYPSILFFTDRSAEAFPVSPELPLDVQQHSGEAFRDFIAVAQENEGCFNVLINFLQHNQFMKSARLNANVGRLTPELLRSDVFSMITDSTIRISKRLLGEYEQLLYSGDREETYQVFLENHPVLLDPLASEVFSKQSLGVEFKSDFVVKRLDNEYIVVEIEKPQDAIFTKSNNFSAPFSHALGQVVDFLEWVDTHGEYARSLMPEISAPKGLLVIGLRSQLSDWQRAKLRRLCVNLNHIEVVTFDDLLDRSNSLYQNLHRRSARAQSCQ